MINLVKTRINRPRQTAPLLVQQQAGRASVPSQPHIDFARWHTKMIVDKAMNRACHLHVTALEYPECVIGAGREQQIICTRHAGYATRAMGSKSAANPWCRVGRRILRVAGVYN
jgi:hypothetical protein